MEFDKDLRARQEARLLAAQAEQAQLLLSRMPQDRLDRITEAMAAAFDRHAEELATLAVEETGFGNVPDKTEKNHFAAQRVLSAIAPMKAVGILKREDKLWHIGVPVGVIGAIVPSTNPTSTVCYKALIALKAGNAIVFSPHPKAIKCTLRAAQLVRQAAVEAGAPEGAIGCLSVGAMAGCQELMACPQVRLILATGGPAMVKAAYSSGKPAIGVGAGNGPAYIHPSADISKAVRQIIRSKTFDNGTVCASEQSVIVERATEQAVRQAFAEQGGYFMDSRQSKSLSQLLFRPGGGLNPEIVGKSAAYLAKQAGFSVPEGTKVLIAREQEAGPTRPYSMEKLCPVLAFFVMDNEDAVLEKVVEVLSHEGKGHTFSLHANSPETVEKFALRIPVSRFLVNTPAALGGIGATTALFPALTLGCGAVGGSSSSNNISPMELVDIRRVAWDTQEPDRPREDPPDAFLDALTEKLLHRLRSTWTAQE